MMQPKQTYSLAAVLLLATSLNGTLANAQGVKPAGEITCTLTVSIELAVGARRPLPCVFQPTAADKPPVPLEVTIDHYGADIRLMKQVDLSWTVTGSRKTPPQRLAGTYNGDLSLARNTDPANALSAGGEFELIPVRHDNPDVFNLANGIASMTVSLN